MLKRVIENYLRASTEREYDIPFRQLLWAMNYELLDSEIKHHSYEFGKDIRAVHKDKTPRVWLFQTKRGDISQDDWNEMERQLKLMLVMPVHHPNVRPDEPIQAVWVCTGDLAKTVSPIMSEFNKEYVAQGHLPVHVWNITTLVDLFEEYFFHVNICPDNVVLDVISLLSSFNRATFNIRRYQSIIVQLLPADLLQEKLRKIVQTLATIEIIAHYVVGRAYQVDDLYAAIDAIQLTIVTLWKFGLKADFQNDLLLSVDRLHDLLIKITDDVVSGISSTFSVAHGLIDPSDSPGTILIYPHRIADLLGMLSYRAWIADLLNQQDIFQLYLTHIENVLSNNPSAAHPIWERAQEDVLLTGYVLWRSKRHEISTKWISSLADWVGTIYTERGGLARPMASYKEVINQLLGIHLSFTNVDSVHSSYLCYSIIELCYWFDLKELYLNFRKKIEHVMLVEFVYKNEHTIYDQELNGYRDQIVPPTNWEDFRAWYHNRYTSEIFRDQSMWSPYLKDRPWLLLLVASCFGNRVFPSLFRNAIFATSDIK